MNQINLVADPADIERYESLLSDFQLGRLAEQTFIGERLQRGIYAQRQDNWYMVRTKLPGGNLNAWQLRTLAEAVERYSREENAHITTRQDIQLHYVGLDDTPELLRLLARRGITTREAGGNTVRNVTTCHLAGACPRERVDTEPFANAVAGYFLNHPLTQSLPRKFKIAFSGCDTDCSRTMVHDLGFIATRRDGEPGFKVLAGGGLGSKPRNAIVLEYFIAEEDLLPVIEAVLALHDRYSDHSRRTRSRLKFLVERFGEKGFRKRYRQELARTRSAFDTACAPYGEWRDEVKLGVDWGDLDPERLNTTAPMAWSRGLVVPVGVPGGELSPEQFRGLARILDATDSVRLRCTQNQNLVLLGVPEEQYNACRSMLAELGFGFAVPGDDVVSCFGTEACPMGITTSARMARTLAGIAPGLRVRVSGCQNGCAWAEIADIGLIGNARRHHGQMVPSYALRLGSDGGFGLTGPDIPAARIPSAVRQIGETYLNDRRDNEDFTAWSHRRGSNYFYDLLEGMIAVRKGEIPFLIRDQGDSAVFQVNAIGIGECAGSQSNPVDKLLLNAAYESTLSRAFATKQKYNEAGDCLCSRLRLTARALLLAAGGEERTPETLAADLSTTQELTDVRLAVEFGELNETMSAFLEDPDEMIFSDLLNSVDHWTESARSMCRHLQAAASKSVPPNSYATPNNAKIYL